MTSTQLLVILLLHSHHLVNSANFGWLENPDILSEVVDVQVRKSRSLDLEDDDLFEVNFRAFDEDHSVRLRRSLHDAEDTSVFGRGFSVTELGVDRHGDAKFTDTTPSRAEVLETENNVYVDPETDTAVHIEPTSNGKYNVNGIIKGRTIVSKKSKLKDLLEGNGTHTISMEKIPKMPDFVDMHRKTKPLKGRTLFQGIPLIEPEVFVMLDYDNTMLHNNDLAAIMDYLVVLFKSVNNRYATLKDSMIIKFKISGLITVPSEKAQPFIENASILNGKGYDIVKILEDFAKWCYTYQKDAPPHDLAALFTGKNMYTLDAGGRYNEGVTGYAFVKGACWVNNNEQKYMGTSVTEDIGGYWYGVFSVAHEFAHNLGAPHDGQAGGGAHNEPSTLDCPWTEGYMMSYDGWGKKSKFYFSPCSARLMKDFLTSNGANCMKWQTAKSSWKESNKDVGDRLSMKAMCQKYTKNELAYVDPDLDPSDLCKNLVCRTPGKAEGLYDFVKLNHAPGDNSPCAKGKRCRNGECVEKNSGQ